MRGQEEPRRHVLSDLEHLVIKPTFPRFGRNAEFPARMSVDERRALVARIEAHPEQYVAQEQVDLSTTPVHTSVPAKYGPAPSVASSCSKRRRSVSRCNSSAASSCAL